MLPRDEAWYPCSFPLKWKCPGTYADEYRYWDPVDNPTADVVHPVWLVVYADDWTYAESIELTITGLYWYFSDIP
jgi:hypothetical protein